MTPLPAEEVARRIHAGRARQREMKRGVVKRYMGCVQQALVATCVQALVLGEAAALPGRRWARRADLLEVNFDANAGLAATAMRKGWTAVQPVEVTEQLTSASAADIVSVVEKWSPRLLIINIPTIHTNSTISRRQQSASTPYHLSPSHTSQTPSTIDPALRGERRQQPEDEERTVHDGRAHGPGETRLVQLLLRMQSQTGSEALVATRPDDAFHLADVIRHKKYYTTPLVIQGHTYRLSKRGPEGSARK